MGIVGHFIGGKHVASSSGRTADILEPMTGEVRGQVALGNAAEVRMAVENAKAAHSLAQAGSANPGIDREGSCDDWSRARRNDWHNAWHRDGHNDGHNHVHNDVHNAAHNG